ncbi:MAG: flagellar hook-length control protein FliK [Oscillospiraceae bacterium]|nr:flagellar hook-length control protein FliK [Oscillospiraceae bacterium]
MAEVSTYSVNNVNNTNPVIHIGSVTQKQGNRNNNRSAAYFDESQNPNENKTQNTENAGNIDNINPVSNTLNSGAIIKNGLKTIPADILRTALRDADIEVTPYTMEIVKSLINGSLPLTEKNITSLLLNSQMFKDTPLNMLALMMRLEIPVTQENVAQFENLLGPEEKLSDKIEVLINKMTGEIFADNKNTDELLSSLSKIINVISDNSDKSDSVGNINNKSAQPNLSQNGITNGKPLFNRYEMSNLLNMLKDLKASESVLNRIAHINSDNIKGEGSLGNAENSADSLSKAQDIFGIINNFVQAANARIQNVNSSRLSAGIITPKEYEQYSHQIFEKVKNLFESTEFQKLLKSAIEDKLFISPKNLSGGQIEKFYNSLNENLNKLIDLTAGNKSGTSAFQYKFQSDAKSIKDCLSLMNELNKTMPFLQIPIKFSDKIVNSDLYIFKNKKRKERSSGNGAKNLNALIKLELENLGKVDIYVNIAGKNVRSKFFADKEESVNEINKNLPALDNIITKMGFNFTSSASSSEKGFDFIDDFINRETPHVEVKKYLFRKKI